MKLFETKLKNLKKTLFFVSSPVFFLLLVHINNLPLFYSTTTSSSSLSTPAHFVLINLQFELAYFTQKVIFFFII